MQSKLFFVLWLLTICCAASSALRCYTCEDCDEMAQVKELEVCIMPLQQQQQQQQTDNPSTSPSTSPSSSPSSSSSSSSSPAAAATAPGARPPAPAVGSGDDVEDYDTDEDESAPAANPTFGIMGAGAGVAAVAGAGTGGAAAAAGGAAAVDSEAEDEEDEDYDERRRKRRSVRQFPSTQRPVCYIAHLQLNGTDITNRGCTLISGDNQTAACTGLFDGWQVVGCDLCESNGCNAPIHSTVFAQANSGYCTWGSWTTLGLMLLAATVIG